MRIRKNLGMPLNKSELIDLLCMPGVDVIVTEATTEYHHGGLIENTLTLKLYAVPDRREKEEKPIAQGGLRVSDLLKHLESKR